MAVTPGNGEGPIGAKRKAQPDAEREAQLGAEREAIDRNGATGGTPRRSVRA